ncbi:MAG: Rho termination factor N-terminal domain-containing protein [Proteobacteria bacterium]|nr:Rho termination factor N-terminal domain-containing protein [Pseudomonadota bacterium]
MDVKELESKTVPELKDLAKEAGISGISSMKKNELIAALAGQAGEEGSVPEPEAAGKEPSGTSGAAKTARPRGEKDVPALKREKRTLKAQIQAALAEKDSAKVRELRNRKKELRRLLHRAVQ